MQYIIKIHFDLDLMHKYRNVQLWQRLKNMRHTPMGTSEEGTRIIKRSAEVKM